MKKLIFFTILILMLTVGITVSAHEGRNDFFDFENYTGNDETLSVLPAGGSWGNFALNNRKDTDGPGSDGVTSELTDKGTSLVLVRRYAKYPGVYYSYKNTAYDVTGTIHSSLSFKINGTINGGYGVFRFRKRGNTGPYNIAMFHDNGTISILGETLKKDGGYIRYSKDKWYDLDVVYDVKSGYCKVHITDGEGFDIFREGCSGYEEGLTSIQLVMFETIGSIKEPYPTAKVYLDNWKIETVPKLYATNNPITFEDFPARTGGANVPGGYMLTGFVAKSETATGYSGVFTEEGATGKSLVLAQNINKPLTLSGSFDNKIVEAAVFETDISLKNLNSDTAVYLGNSAQGYAEAIRIMANTGDVYAYSQKTGMSLIPNKSYHITIAYDCKSRCGYLTCDDGEKSITSNFESSLIPVTWVNAYRLALENHTNYSGSTMKALLDNIRLSSGDNIYHPLNEAPYDFDIADYRQCGDDAYMIRMNNPIDTSVAPAVTVNKEKADYSFVDANTLKVYYPQEEGEVNVKISGIKDVFGSTVTTSCELVNVNMTESLKISNPVFLAESLGVESQTDSVSPGKLTAVINIKSQID